MAPLIGEMDIYLFHAGCHYEPYRMLGANVRSIDGIVGVQFAVWAPNGSAVYLVCDMNQWNGQMNPMRLAKKLWNLGIVRSGCSRRDALQI